MNNTSEKKVRLTMLLRSQAILSSSILSAIETIPREKFIDSALRHHAYENASLPIACGQTISQPYIVAKMTELLEVNSNHKVLEIGTGSGYQCAILSKLVRRIYTTERIKDLHDNSIKIFEKLNLSNIVTRYQDGNEGWIEQIPFDRVIFTAATKNLSEKIFSHITDNGIIVCPIIKNDTQILTKYIKKNGKISYEEHDKVLFVPNLEGTN